MGRAVSKIGSENWCSAGSHRRLGDYVVVQGREMVFNRSFVPGGVRIPVPLRHTLRFVIKSLSPLSQEFFKPLLLCCVSVRCLCAVSLRGGTPFPLTLLALLEIFKVRALSPADYKNL